MRYLFTGQGKSMSSAEEECEKGIIYRPANSPGYFLRAGAQALADGGRLQVAAVLGTGAPRQIGDSEALQDPRHHDSWGRA